jgi:hypothetical protein
LLANHCKEEKHDKKTMIERLWYLRMTVLKNHRTTAPLNILLEDPVTTKII